jgi:hypothetical protein
MLYSPISAVISLEKSIFKYFFERCNLACNFRISPTELLTFTRKEKSWSIAGCFARVFRT